MPKRDASESDDAAVGNAGSDQKRLKKDMKGAQGIDDDGRPYWEISRNRRVTLSEFKAKSMVNIREYYEKDGKMLPGKKGISLPIEQFAVVIDLLPQIEASLRDKGVSVPRPRYDEIPNLPTSDGDEDSEDGSDGHDKGFARGSRVTGRGTGVVSRSKSRANHEATDDDDEDDDE